MNVLTERENLIEALAEELIQIHKREKELKQRKKEVQEELKSAMKEQNLNKYVSKRGEVLLTTFKKRQLDTRKLKEEQPEIYERFLVEREMEQIRITHFEEQPAE